MKRPRAAGIMARAGAVPFWGLLGAVLAIPLLAGPAGAQQPPPQAVRQIEALLAAKAQRTPAQRKVSSQLLEAQRTPPQRTVNSQLLDEQRTPTQQKLNSQLQDALRAPLQKPTVAGTSRLQATDPDAKNERVMVDIRTDVTPTVLKRIRDLGGTVISSVPKYRAIRAQLPLAAVGRLAALAAVQTIRPADEAVTRKDNTTQGDGAHRANAARTTYGVDGTGIGIGVISDGVRTLADRQASGDVSARVTVLPGQAGARDEGTALLEILHDLAPGAELYFATGLGGQARMAVNIEALCEAGANVIVDDIGYLHEAAFQDDIVAQGVNAAVADGCVFFSAGGNDGNLTNGTSGVWEGDYAAGSALEVDGRRVGTKHDFGGGVEANELRGRSVRTIILQWADPLGASTNDYDLFLVNENGDVIASSTDTQDGTQDPIESISSPIFDYSGLRVVVVKASGANRYLRVQALSGPLAIATAGTLYGHSAQENAVSVAMVDVATAGGSGGVFDGTESVRSGNSDGPRRIFFQPDGTAITAGNFSATGGKLLQKPDLTAATCVATATPGFSRFCGTSAAAPHAAAIGALMLEAAGGPDQVTLAQLRTAMTGAALDIEAAGVDRDSGAGIVMAPGAVDAVDVAVADRNGAPTVTSSQSNRTFAAGAAAVTIDLANVFEDPDNDTLTYTAVSSDPDRLAITRSGSVVTLTPGSPGRAVVTLRASDPHGLSAVETFSVTVTAGNRDYDADNDGFIDVANLAQLDAVRYDLNGDGLVDGATWMPYYDAFPMGARGMGCPSAGCTGYELTANLDFDTNSSGDADVGDTYWNAGAGWAPIGEAGDPFTADFEGEGYTVANLFIDRDTEDGVGLFGEIGGRDTSVIRGVGLVGVDVTGSDGVGSLLGHGVYATVIDSYATGRVSGQDEVGGLVGRTWGRVLRSYAAVNVSGADAVGGLVGHQILNDLDSSYATGNVEGTDAVGGLVGAVSDTFQTIVASYATGDVAGGGARLSESDSGFIICDSLSSFTTSGPVETATNSGGGVGGLVGSSCGVIRVSYATGEVSGDVAVGGLIGSGYVRVQSSYWDLETSGVRVGVGEDDENDNGVIDGTESQRLGVGGKTTAELQTPTDYTGIYAAWNVDLDGSSFSSGEVDDPWDFGTSTQYPVLSLDLNDDNRATWQEFGYQVRSSLTLTAATTASQAQVVLSWTAISTSSWSPAPDVSYTLYRDDGTTIEAIETNLTGLTHTDTDVTINGRYTYWVAVVVDGGEAVRSAPVSVTAGVGNQPPVAVGIVADRALEVGATALVVDVAGAFLDPDDDALTYAATSSRTSVATLSRSDSMLTITPGSAGRTTITVTATDAGGSNMGATQRFAVRVGYNYDADGDRLIGISNLAQFDAMHYDLNGNGLVTGDDAAAYAAAFPDAFDRLGCGIDGCAGYELLAALDFDTDGDGSADAGDTYWNGGAGWEPIGVPSGRFFGTVLGAFNATFDGNGHSIAHLFVARDDHSGLFGAIGSRGAVRDVRLTDMDVTGNQGVGGLAGENLGVVSRVQSAGQVLGEVQVGGLVGANLGTITLSRSSAAVTGMAPPDFVRTSDLDRGTGGLVGYNGGAIRGSYAIGRVVGDSNVGGLVGWNFNDGFVGSIRRHASIVGSYATGSVAGRSSVGGLVGTNGIPGNAPFVLGEIHSSYATGRVSGPSRGVGGLVGYDSGDDSTIITASYWDTNTSGQTSGSFGIGKTTAQLKAPTGYSGIYRSWNVDVDDDGTNDAWHFGTGRQYPVLKANVDGQGAATWQEFGYQLRSGPTLMTPTVMPTMTAGQAQVNLTWTAVDASHWAPEPDVTYTVTRADGDTLETLAEDLGVLLYTDSAARTGAAITYQVVAVVDGGEPVRSAAVVVNTPGNSPPLPVGTLSDRWLHAGDEAGVEVGAAFQDPENDTLTYTAASSATGVVMVSVSGSRVTITPVATGTATITVTATDAGGSMASGTQTFTVTVRPSSATDYDADDDGLIEITELEQLDAIRHDLNGDGVPTTDGATAYAAAFSTVGDRQACGGLTGCVGYELADNLDFDTNSNGSADSGDTYWNAGAGWEPIDADTSSSTPGVIVFRAGFRAIFEGNGHTIANLFIDRDSDDVGLFGRTSYGSVIRHVGLIDVEVSGSSDVGGLAGTDNNSSIIGSYVTGMVSGTGDNVGGLVGQTYGSSVVTSYAAVEVTGGNNVGGLIGENDTAVTASYATGWVAGDDNVGGLVGSNGITITASYATGPVTGQSNVGGLVGRNTRSFSSTGTVTASYWDTSTSGQTTGSGRTTAQLQAPTSYSGIYQRWNVDLDGDGVSDNPWDFGTADQYPALKTNFDGQGTASWQEFGRQLRKGPTLTTTVGAAQVVLTWTPVDASVWTPPPEVTYTLYRDNGTAVETVAADLDGRQHTDTGVITGVTYTYQVAAVVQGGEAVRSARVSVRAVMPTTSVVVLKLMPDSIGENGGVSTVTASLDRMSSAVTTVTVSAAAVHPTLSKDFMLSTNQTLTIPAGQLDSTGTVTVQAVNNNVYDPNKTVTVSAMATNMRGVTTPPAVTLAIRDDDPAPELTLEVGPSAIVEAGGNSTVTVRITNGVTFAEDQKIALAFAGTAAKGTDYTVGLEMLTLTAGQISAVTTVTATDDRVDDDNETILLTASHGGGTVGAEQTITITDDDASPVITTASLILVVENETAVATLAAADADLPAEDLTWRITGGGDRNKFRLTADGVLTFAAAPDYEEPDDSDGDGDYEVAVQVTDGFNPVEAVFTVRLQDVDDTAPVLSSTVVNGATLTLTYGEMLDGSSTPLASAFTVTGGDTSRTVTDVFLNGSAVLLTVDPAVEHGETGIRVSYTVPTGTGTSPLQDVLGNDVDRLSNVPVSNETPDTTSPTVRRLAITSDPGTDRTYAVDDEIQVTVTFSETVEVTGTPQLRLELGGGRRTADYEGGSGTAALVFAYKVADGESDTDGMGIEADSLSGGTIRDEARNNAELDHDGLAADSGHKVDGVRPRLAASGGAVVDGTRLTLTYDEALDGGSRPVSGDFTVSGGDRARAVTGVRVNGSAVELTLDVGAEHGEAGIQVSYTPGANPIQDVPGNDAEALSREPVTNDTPDTTSPTVSSLAITSNPGGDQIYAAEDEIEVTVTFDETVVVTRTPRMRLRVGSRNRTAGYLRGSGAAALVFSYEVALGDEDTDGVSIAAGRIDRNGGTIKDEADNDAVLDHEAVAPQAGHKVDGVRPAFLSAAVDGSSLTLTYGEALDGGSRPAPGDFTVEVGGTGRSVSAVSVSGSVVTLTLDPAVKHGDTGIRVNYSPGTRPIRDAVGNDALALSNRSVTNTTGAPPSVTLQLMPTSISENGGSATVTARLSHTSGETTTVTVSATAVSPAVSGDFTLSMNKTLMIEAAQAASTGTVTITANNNGVDAPNKTVMVMGTATNSEGVTGPSDETLTITDDDATPVITTAALIPVAENETVVATLLATDEDDRTEDLVWDITGGNDRSQFTLTRGGELAFTAAKDYEEPDDSDRDRDYEVTVQVSDGANAVEADFTVRLQDVDDTAPTVSGIRISSNPGTDRTYAAGDEIRVTVTFSETVEVTGAPQLSLELGGGRRTATYEGGSGTAALVFAYEVAGGESDTDGVGVEAGSLSGGTIRDEARNNAELDHDGLAADSGHKVDAVKPQLAATGGVVVDGAALTLTYGELLDGSSTLAASDFTVSGGDLARTVSNAAVSGSAVALTLDPAVEHGETGVTVSYTPGTNPIRDVAGNEAEALSRVPVNNETPDTTAPGVISLAISSNPGSDQAYAAEDVIEVTVSFSETVEVTGTPQVRLRVGSSNRTADYLRGTDTEELVFAYEVADGDEDTDGVSIEAGRIALNGGTIEDEADNPAELAHEAVAAQVGHKVDGVRPVFVSAAVDGSSLTLTYGETLDGGSRPAPGDFTVEVDGAGRSVTGVSVSGSVVTLTLSTAVEHGDTGIRVSYTPGTNPIQDAVGNDARGLSNQAVTNTTGAPNTAPEITTVGPFTVRENQALVRRLAARDDDSGDEVTGWSIMGGADQSQFSITSDTGVLSFQEAPDYESPTDVVSGDPPSGAGDNEYVVTVEVRSGAGARELEAEQTFAVRVTDEREPPDIPEAPAFSGETAGSLTVHWSEPENTGPPIMDYDVRYREGSRGGFTDAQHMGPGLSLTLDDLEPGTAYEVQVRATNDEGTSDWSEPGEGMTVTPLTVEMMGGTEPPVEGPFTVRFSFSEPVRGFTQAAIETAQDPACTDEQNNPVFCEPDIGRLETVDDRVFSTTVTPQTDRVAHNYTLTLTVSGGAVRSSVGNKLNEEAMLGGRVAPPGVTLPISEIGLRASGLDRAGRLNWNRPTNDGGSPIIRYEHRHAPVGEVWNDWENVGARATGVTVGNLVNGLEYVFEVRAVNALGKGPVETAAATPVLRTGPPPPPPPPPPPGPRKTVPDAPTNLLADGGNEQVALSWEAPENDGGFAITDYEVRINGRGSWISTGSIHTTHTVTGLTNGTAYVFQVRAVNAAGSSPYSNRAEATPGVGALDFAHFANGAGIISDLVFVNVATHPIRPVLYFYGQEGQPIDPESMVDLTEDLEVTEDGALSIRTEMEPLGELTISTHGRGEVMSGSVQVAADGPIGGVLRFDLPGIGVAGVGASQPVRDALFPARRQAGGIATAAAIRNLGEEALVVSCRLMSGGIVLEAVEISLAANGQEARYIEELFTGTDTSDFVGSVRCTAPGLFTGIAVELDDSNRIFTTLPVVPVARTGGRGQEAGLDFAHFANGDGIVSGMVFVNLSTQPSGPGPTPFHAVIRPTRPVLYFYDKGGNLIDPESVVDLTGDLEVTEDGALSIHSEMGPLEELTISTHGRGEVVTGSVTVISEGPIGGVLRFDLPGIGVAGVGASQPVRDALFPARRQAGGISTAAAIHNLEANAQGVACQLMKGGVVLEETEIPLAANGQQARFIEEVFPRTDTSDFVGSVRCTAPGRFTGVAVELDAGNRIFTTLPVVPVPERMSQE